MGTSTYRIPVDINANLIIDNQRYEVKIMNLSENGACIANDNLMNKIELPAGKLLGMEFLDPEKEIINVNCEVVWSNKTDQDDEIYNLGLQLVEIPAEYDDFFQSLYVSNMRSL
jgi:hypothetical protein